MGPSRYLQFLAPQLFLSEGGREGGREGWGEGGREGGRDGERRVGLMIVRTY